MNVSEDLNRRLQECPLIAIIRGVQPDEAGAIGDVLVEAGIRIIEVPLNSPSPFESIGKLVSRVGDRALVGAGTVLQAADVQKVRDAGGKLIVAPNFNPSVVEAALRSGMISLPGIFTPTEAFAALAAGAHGLKLFPAEAASPKVVNAIRAVLPRETPLIVVGGVSPDSIPAWREAGADGFGLGSGVYRPGQSASEVRDTARAYVEAVKR